MSLQLLVSKILLTNVPLTQDSPSLHCRLMIGAQWPCEGRGSWMLLGKKSSFTHVTCKGQMRKSWMLIAHFTPNSVLHHGEWFFQWCHPIPENNNNKEYINNIYIYIYQQWQHCLLYTRQLININPLHLRALCNKNTNSRFTICRKVIQKWVSMQDLLAPAEKFIIIIIIAIKNCDSPAIPSNSCQQWVQIYI
jgi:hypothetical protein